MSCSGEVSAETIGRKKRLYWFSAAAVEMEIGLGLTQLMAF
jgi:hypothetical protein